LLLSSTSTASTSYRCCFINLSTEIENKTIASSNSSGNFFVSFVNASFKIWDDDRQNALRRLANLRNNIVHYFQYYINEVEEGLFMLNEIVPFLREVITEVSDSEKYDDLFDEKTINKLQKLERRLTKMKNNELHQKINERKKHYYDMAADEIEINKQLNIRDFHEEREILKEGLQCPSCGNSLHILKIFSEESEDPDEFIIKGVCLVCGLELTEEDIKSLNITI